MRPGTTFAFELESCIGILDVSLTVPTSDDLSKMVNKWKFTDGKLTITLNNALTKNGVLTVRYLARTDVALESPGPLQSVQVTKEGNQCGKAARVLDPAWKMTDGGLELKVSVTDKKSDERFMSNGIIFLDNNQLGTNGNSRKSLRVVLVIDCCLRLLN